MNQGQLGSKAAIVSDSEQYEQYGDERSGILHKSAYVRIVEGVTHSERPTGPRQSHQPHPRNGLCPAFLVEIGCAERGRDDRTLLSLKDLRSRRVHRPGDWKVRGGTPPTTSM